MDFARLIADVPRHYSLKGMFFTRHVDETWKHVESELELPPKNGKYHAFESYPIADYYRIYDRIARARFPGSTREAYRLLARGEVDVFAESTLGKVTFSMIRDPESALKRYPEVINMLSKGPSVSAEHLGPKKVAIRVERFYGPIEQIIGILEGLTMAFDETPSLDVEVDQTARATFVVRW